uniref:Uncharacterized protein n=1 Tax=Arundo donax TaxID=35708 RepID=A0A0A9AXW9_ARUDO
MCQRIQVVALILNN